MRAERWIYAIPLRLRSLFRRKAVENELDEEVQFHLERQAEMQMSKGVSPEEARYAALRALGNTTLVKEDVRQAWGWCRWDILKQDIRYALRLLRKSPGFTLTAVLTLALGIGASTAVFTIVDSILLKPLSYRDSGSLVAVWERVRFLSPEPIGPNPRHVDVWNKRATSFSGGLALLRQSAIGLTLGTDHPQLAGTVLTTPNLFEVLQVAPLLGRTFRPEDGIQGRDNVVVLTYSLWQSLFHGDPNVVGRFVRLGDVPREVIGVLPASFHFPNRNALRAFPSRQPLTSVPESSIFVPAAIDLTQFSWSGEYGNWVALARLNPGVGTKRAEAELNSIEAQSVQDAFSGRERRPDALLSVVEPMQEAVTGDSKAGLWFLMAAVIGLMSIACINLANTQLARTLWRHREASIRSALGAPKWRLVWNSLLENLLVAVVAGAAGVLLAAVGLDAFRRYAVIDLPRLSEVRLNTTVLLFSMALTLGSTLLFSVLPALYLLRTDPQAFLQQRNDRALGNRQSRRLHTWLIGLQIFGCTALLFVTGLFSKNLLNLLHQEKGFETGQVAFAQVTLSGETYGPAQTRVAFIDAVLENLRSISGVQAAGLISTLPLEGESWIESLQRVDRPNEKAPLINLRWVSPGYFEAMRHKLVAGRFFEERDRSLNSAVLTDGEARALWPNEDPIGGKVETEGRQFTVIGVVADSRSTSLKSPPAKIAYLHYKDRTPATLFFMARGAQSGDALAATMRQAIWHYAPGVTIARAKSLDEQVSESLEVERFQTFVLTAFGISALFLAMIGIHGVLSYSVATRRQEIGVRMAIGATPRQIYTLTFGEVGAPVLAGLGAGLVASLMAGRIVRRLLHGVQNVDASVMVIVAVLFLASAMVAGFLPARQAASVDPMESLRSE
jgi:predicted permease